MLLLLATAAPAAAQNQVRLAADDAAQSDRATLCGQEVPVPATQPPADSPPLFYMMGLCFPAQGNVSLIDPTTYLHYIEARASRPTQNEWVPYDETLTATLLADFRRLWATNFLDDLRIESDNYTFANGVPGKLVTFYLEERQRVKIVNYEGSKEIDQTALEARLRERNIVLRLDSFVDQNTLRLVKGVVSQMLAEKGFANAEITHAITEVGGGPKLINVTFHVKDGPKTLIRDVEFVGNRSIADSALTHVIKQNRPRDLFSFLRESGSYKAAQFAEDAQRIEDYYRDRGFVAARVGEPELRHLYDSTDGAARWVQLRIPVSEGPQYRVGTISFDGNTIVDSATMSRLFPLKGGELYSQKSIREGLEKAREIYGAAGHMEFTGFPDLKPSDQPDAESSMATVLIGKPDGVSREDGAQEPTVDVTLRVAEGPRYSVNRITITGNTTTRDNVIRREMQLLEGGVFNAEALKYSVRRINQLGYFKPLEGTEKDLKIDKSTEKENAVDVTLKVEEQNRNQMNFGAGVSQYDGLFGSLSFTTANFMGRGESLTLSGQKGSRSTNLQLAFTEPFLFDRPISAGFNLFSTKVDYLMTTGLVGYSEVREGAAVTIGRQLFRFSRVFLNYAYEIVDTAVSDDFLSDVNASATGTGIAAFNPLRAQGHYTESRLGPSFLHTTIDNPFMPRQGFKIELSLPVAGGFLGGTTDYIRPEIEAVVYIPHTRRTALGLRAQGGWIRPYGTTRELPYYLRFFLGGEYQIRGVDIRTVGPTDTQGRALGGDKFVLFNAEYYFDIFGPVRALLFHDAGQAFDEKHGIELKQLRTSSGAEVRFMVPMLNVPFRLIYAWNVYRDSFQPERTFKFAVGTTF